MRTVCVLYACYFCTPGTETQYESKPPVLQRGNTYKSDRECSGISSACSSSEYEITAPTASSDRHCVECKAECESQQVYDASLPPHHYDASLPHSTSVSRSRATVVWRVESGEWRVESGEWRVESARSGSVQTQRGCAARPLHCTTPQLPLPLSPFLLLFFSFFFFPRSPPTSRPSRPTSSGMNEGLAQTRRRADAVTTLTLLPLE